MFIVLHKPTGKYFKKHNWRKPSEPIVAEKDKARVYRSKGAALMSVGKWNYVPREERTSRNFGYYSLDENIWKIVTVSLVSLDLGFITLSEYYYVTTAIGFAMKDSFEELEKLVDTLISNDFEIENIALVLEEK